MGLKNKLSWFINSSQSCISFFVFVSLGKRTYFILSLENSDLKSALAENQLEPAHQIVLS